jgi:hypothetical protein
VFRIGGEIGEPEDRLHGAEIDLDLVAVSLMHYRKTMMKAIVQIVVRKIYWLVTGSLRQEPEKGDSSWSIQLGIEDVFICFIIRVVL